MQRNRGTNDTPATTRAADFGKLSRKRPRLHTATVVLLTFAAVTPMLLSPTHPIAVYGYLAEVYGSSLIAQKAYAAETSRLPEFLTSYAQAQRYRRDLFDDVIDTNTGRLFVIVRRPDNSLHQEAIRTWNGFLPAGLPKHLTSWLDRKEIPFLGDEVALWLDGDTIEAHGHYHSFGGPPSPGDIWTMRHSSLPEVVISNGVIPMVYLNGTLTPYGHGPEVYPQVFRTMRALEDAFVVDGSCESLLPSHPTAALRSALGYIREFEKGDVRQVPDVAQKLSKLCAEFRGDYGGVFTEERRLSSYKDDPDAFNLLSKVQVLQGWSAVFSHAPAL